MAKLRGPSYKTCVWVCAVKRLCLLHMLLPASPATTENKVLFYVTGTRVGRTWAALNTKNFPLLFSKSEYQVRVKENTMAKEMHTSRTEDA